MFIGLAVLVSLERIKQIEAMFARFLRAGLDMSKKLLAIIWDKVCEPYEEGGLNLKRVKEMNITGIMKQIWWIASHKFSMWVKWVHTKVV